MEAVCWFWSRGHGLLVFIDGNMNQDLYIDWLSQSLLTRYNELPSSEGREYIFQENNAAFVFRKFERNISDLDCILSYRFPSKPTDTCVITQKQM